jgi:hypothetical protein
MNKEIISDGNGYDAEYILLDGKYTGIENDLKKIIQEALNSNNSRAAMKKLFYSSNNTDYSSLKDFYLNVSKLKLDTVTKKLTLSLINRCNIELNDYTKAIQWYRNMINNSTLKQDSIYSQIDLNYLLMQIKEESLKNELNNSFNNEVGKDFASSETEFRKNEDYLIRKLFEEDESFALGKINFSQDSSDFHLFQNYPNPFKGETKLNYYLPCQSQIQIIVSDMVGRSLMCLNRGTQAAGSHEFTLNCDGLTSGCYLVSLTSNNKDVSRIKIQIIE